MTFKLNGTELPIQPTEAKWNPRNILGVAGDGHAIYPGIRDFTMRWQLLDSSGTYILQNFFNGFGATGTIVADLPKYGNYGYAFYAYSGCIMREPEFGSYFSENITNVTLDITRIRVS